MLLRAVRSFALSCAVLPILLSQAGAEDQDVLKIFDRFVTAEIVATRCGQMNEETVQKYQANFMALMPAVYKQLAEMREDLDKKQRQAIIEARRQMLRQNVTANIQDMGCDHETIQKILALYKVHAEWNASGDGA
ncbi:hypothetical protein [Aestuariispira insulae]|uniref:LTXXQ motif family protein n=1 Tax=Aestuariispira insulae TaxID=1461337 RepID=A0A3D9HX41_9PROT|nr:hypothetical protein [Aestuariispira insulae]RED53985.1 hypothetical protein DFP90_101784 [Aestuariispira insulae]